MRVDEESFNAMAEHFTTTLTTDEHRFVDRTLHETYARVCASEEGYAGSRDAFLADAAAGWGPTLLRIFREAERSTAAGWLQNSYRRFLANGRGCHEATPAYRHAAAEHAPRPVPQEQRELLPGGGLRIATGAGDLLIGVAPPTEGRSESNEGGLVVPLKYLDEGTFGIPTLRAFAGGIYTPLEALPLADAPQYGGVEILRLSDYGIRLFVDGAYLGDVTTTDAFAERIARIDNLPTFVAAWKRYTAELFRRAQEALVEIDRYRSGRGSMDRILAARRNLVHVHEAHRAFTNNRAFEEQWGVQLIRFQTAWFNNALFGTSLLPFMLASSQRSPEYAITVMEEGLGRLFEPFQHLDQSYHHSRDIERWVQLTLPEELPDNLWNGDLEGALALRGAIDAIMDAAGNAAQRAEGIAQLHVSWDAERGAILFEDRSEGFDALAAFDLLDRRGGMRAKHVQALADIRHGISQTATGTLHISLYPTTPPSPPTEGIVISANHFAGFADASDDPRAADVRERFAESLGTRWTGAPVTIQERAVQLLLLFSDAEDRGLEGIPLHIYPTLLDVTAAGAPVTIMRAGAAAVH